MATFDRESIIDCLEYHCGRETLPKWFLGTHCCRGHYVPWHEMVCDLTSTELVSFFEFTRNSQRATHSAVMKESQFFIASFSSEPCFKVSSTCQLTFGPMKVRCFCMMTFNRGLLFLVWSTNELANLSACVYGCSLLSWPPPHWQVIFDLTSVDLKFVVEFTRKSKVFLDIRSYEGQWILFCECNVFSSTHVNDCNGLSVPWRKEVFWHGDF